ncbi:MAG TPA: riboflavin synthase [Thermohalobaculum sp.]|nr:riboflavin synthase [Thermohalobaculum sp.]
MFTGIIREVGTLLSRRDAGDTYLRIGCRRATETIEIGASIACNGICLTVMETGTDNGQNWFEVAASAETKSKTTLSGWQPGQRINLEPSLRLGDEMGGHIVSGHVDGVGEITTIRPDGDSHRLSLRAPAALAKFIANKGSVCVDGISLTVNEVEDDTGGTTFGVSITPHTWVVTSLAGAEPGGRVNLEIDLMARYVARLNEMAS